MSQSRMGARSTSDGKKLKTMKSTLPAKTDDVDKSNQATNKHKANDSEPSPASRSLTYEASSKTKAL